MSEGRFLFYTISAIFLLMAIHIFQPQLNSLYNPFDYTGIHTLLEVISISISTAIFFYGLKSFGKTRSSRMLLVSFTFFFIAALDLLHMISFKGMPFFITDSSLVKATWFWIFARMFNSILLLAILLIPDRKLVRDYRSSIIFLGIMITALIGFFVFRFEGSLPLLMIEGKGTTGLNNGMEYLFSLILFVSLILTLYQYHLEKSTAKLAIGLALVFMLFTELLFTIYQSNYDLDHFAGHVFKVLGFYFMLKGFYFSVEENIQHEQVNRPFFNEFPGCTFKVVKRGDDFLTVFCEGDLLQELGFTGEDFIGKSLPKVFLNNQVPLEEYFRLSLKLRENLAFDLPYRGKSLLFSLKPLAEQDDREELIGTVSDMTGIYQAHQLNQNDQKNIKIVM